YRTFARPTVGFATLAVVLLTYFGGVRFRGGLPGGVGAGPPGPLLAWAGAARGARGAPPPRAATLHLPGLALGDLAAGFGAGHLLAYASVIIPMSLFTLIGSLQNIESAEAAGDTFATAP